MATSPTKRSAKAEFNTFVQGLITEASPLNFPVNASVDEQNFELNRDGTRDRRRGMDYEGNFVQIPLVSPAIPTAEFRDFSFSTFVWDSPGGFVDRSLVVIQTGQHLKIFDTEKESISSEGVLADLLIDQFPDNVRYSYGVVNGKLIVAAGVDQVLVVDFDGLITFPFTYQRLTVRDVWGIQPEAFNEANPNGRNPAGPDKHIYNLMNQGWGPSRRGQIVYSGIAPPVITENPGMVNPIIYFNGKLGGHPADTESVYTGLQFQPTISNVTNAPTEQMISDLYNESRNTTQAPAKGFFIIDFLRRGQSRIDAQTQHASNYAPVFMYVLPNTLADFSPGGASVVRGFAGRMFYAGFSGEVQESDNRSPSIESFVLFSQLVKHDKDITRCYQEGDPTSREASEVVDTDGGFIRISGCARIVAMRALGASLIVFATNGVWEINGGSDFGFSATNFKVTKLSSVGAFSESNIVDEVGKLYFWSLDGIYVVGADQFQVNSVQNLTHTTIQTRYDNIPTRAKEHAVGVYDAFSKRVRWVFNQGTEFSTVSDSQELIFDTVLQAFYVNKIGNLNNSIEVISAFITPPFRTGDNVDAVIADTDVVFSDVDAVVIDAVERVSGLQSVKYVVLTDVGGFLRLSFSLYNNVEFTDWQTADDVGVDAKAFLLTGSQIAGDSSVSKQIPYLTMHFRRTENGLTVDDEVANPSSCFVRSQWNFANTATSNKWGSLFQAYRYTSSFLITDPNYDSGFELITTKNKLRGRGSAFSLYMESEPKKDLRIVGWNLQVNGNAI